MSDWKRVRLGEVTSSYAGGTPNRSNPEYFGGSIPWVKSTEVNLGRILSTEESITDKGLKLSSAKWIPSQTVLVALYGATAAQVAFLEIEATANQAVLAVITSEEINSRFLFYSLTFLKSKILYLAQGSGQPNLNKQIVDDFHIDLPLLPEQQKIAEILNTIDRTITHTEALIEKYQQIKAGLMHDLFTRGIGADGKLRPTREQAPDLYRESAIGWIPKEWEVKCCSDLCARICVGIVIQPTQYYVSDGVPAFRSANIREDGIDPNNFVYISPYSNNLLAKSQVKEGDILSVRTGYPGTSAVVPKEFIGANCIDILISTPGNQINSDYLCHWINSSFGKEQVLRQQGGMAQQHFNVGEMRQLLVALPSMSEQLLITDRLKICANRLKAEQANLIKLQKQKSGLMHDLLTGKVQVTIEEAA